MKDPKALERGLLALQEDFKTAATDERRGAVRAQYRALHARWMGGESMRPAAIVLVCGSRDWSDPGCVLRRLGRLRPGTRIIHGAARGADKQAATIARGLGLEERAYRADWRGQGRHAGILRNLQMLDEQPDLVIAFQRNGSRGTQHTIDEARRRGIPVEVHTA